jgi:glycosyltransferase involved in cell wall biosynthesis
MKHAGLVVAKNRTQTMSASSPALPLTIITHEFFPMKGGIATFVEEMARGCHDLGHRVEVWAPRTTHPLDHRFPYPVYRVPVRGTQDLTCQFRMLREILRQRHRLRPGILYLPEPGPILAMMHLNFLGAFRPARLALTLHGSEVLRFASRPVLRMLTRRLLRTTDRITTPSLYTRDLVLAHFPEAASKTVVTAGAPRAGFFDRQLPRIRTSDKVVIVSVGRLHPRKGQMHVLEALDRLPDDVARQVEYWIVGRSVRGGYEAELRRRARHLKVPVTFYGNIDKSVQHGRSVEGFGLAYLEASSFGLPVVGHAVGGVPEAVRDGETGLLVPPGDTAALTSALERLIVDRALRERLGARGLAWARSHSWRQSAGVLLDGLIPAPQRAPLPVPVLQPV